MSGSEDTRAPPSSRGRRLVGEELERCIYCNGTQVTREGKRYKKLETVQLWYCRTCDKVFSPQRVKGKQYPLKVILESLITYYRGETRERTAAFIHERFMLATDSATVAVEVPIYLTPDELAELKAMPGFDIPLESNVTVTGHIDFLQIRNGAIHIVDYKPGAKSEKPIPQLMTYALALSRRTGLRLFHFVCSWFDQGNYYQFYPLHVVHKRGPPAESPPRAE